MAFELPPLPYASNALEPYMTRHTMDLHHGKHHKAYVDTANRLLAGTPLEGQSLEEIIRATAKDTSRQPLFNAAAQAWNHTFFWHSMRPGGGGQPKGDVHAALERGFGGYDKFREEFKAACVSQFGSGWGWLVLDGSKLAVVKTPNAINPLSQGSAALLCCDVWEHAYYLDFENRRAEFVDSFLDHLVNWDHVAQQLKGHARRVA